MKGRVIPLCYLGAAVLWLVLALTGVVNQLVYGKGDLLLSGSDFECSSFVPYADLEWNDPPYDEDDPNWYLSTDGDPQLVWRGEEPRYLSRVVLRAVQYYPPGSVMLYYLKPGQTDFRESQKLFARVTGEGEYTFQLGGVRVSALRIDPDSRGGVPTLFYGVTLGTEPLYRHFIPDGFEWLALLFGPLAFAAALTLLREIFSKGGR